VVVGALSAQITGYGGLRELVIGLLVLSVSVLLYAYRQVVQEGRKFAWKALAEVHEGPGRDPGSDPDDLAGDEPTTARTPALEG
jgi:hypothetical protein